MNGFLWLGVACTAILVIAILVDGADEIFDALDLGVSWISLPVIAAFLAAFGFATGAFIDEIGAPALGIGAVTGLGFGFGAYRLSKAVMHMPTDPTESADDLLASFGHIVTPTSPGRYGEVLLRRPGGPLKVTASSTESLPAGTEVVVVDVTSSTLVTVEPFDHGAPHLDR